MTRAEAKAAGLPRFSSGKPCKYGHQEGRYVCDYACIVCSLNKARSRRAVDYEKVYSYRKNWRAANVERCREVDRKWYRENSARSLENSKRWASENPDTRRAKEAGRRAAKRGCDGQYTASDVSSLVSLQKWRCAMCLASVKRGFHVDHIIPLKLGGSNARKNIQILCAKCNLTKNAKHPIVFAQELGMLL